jgi:hypothetical protein
MGGRTGVVQMKIIGRVTDVREEDLQLRFDCRGHVIGTCRGRVTSTVEFADGSVLRVPRALDRHAEFALEVTTPESGGAIHPLADGWRGDATAVCLADGRRWDGAASEPLRDLAAAVLCVRAQLADPRSATRVDGVKLQITEAALAALVSHPTVIPAGIGFSAESLGRRVDVPCTSMVPAGQRIEGRHDLDVLVTSCEGRRYEIYGAVKR